MRWPHHNWRDMLQSCTFSIQWRYVFLNFSGTKRTVSSITAFSAATTGVTYAIVGDFGEGAIANFPNGEDITIKYDDLSLAEKDLVKLVGREFIGIEVVGPKSFVKIAKASE